MCGPAREECYPEDKKDNTCKEEDIWWYQYDPFEEDTCRCKCDNYVSELDGYPPC